MRAFCFLMFWMSFMWTRIFWALSTLVYFPRKVSFFLEKNHGKSGFCGFKDQHFSLFYFTRYIEEWFFPQFDGWNFCVFFRLEVCFQFWRGSSTGISRPQPFRKKFCYWHFPGPKNEGKKNPPPDKKDNAVLRKRILNLDGIHNLTFSGAMLLNFQGVDADSPMKSSSTQIHLLVPSQPGSPSVSFREGSI